jgi:hypothetical protein
MDEIKTFRFYATHFSLSGFHKEAPPPPPDTPKERAEKDLLIKEWLKNNEIKKFPYRSPQ